MPPWMGAALAMQAAGRQGKAWEMHDKIFENNKALDPQDFEKHAEEIGLDVAKFKQDMGDPSVKAEVLADQKIANSVGAGGTPTFFINGRRLVGAKPYAEFKSIIDEQIKKADELIKKGTPKSQLYKELSK